MAQSASPFGLRVVGSLMASPYSGKTYKCLITASDGNNMGIGDPVDLYGDADTPGFYPTVTLATAGATYPIFGVITSFAINPDALYTTYRPASTARYAYVCVDPFAIFEVQAGATVLPNTAVGLNAVLKAGAVNQYTGLSGWYMDSGDTTAPADNSTYQLQTLGLANRPNNDITQAYCIWRVKINLHRLSAAGVATAGSALAGPLGV